MNYCKLVRDATRRRRRAPSVDVRSSHDRERPVIQDIIIRRRRDIPADNGIGIGGHDGSRGDREAPPRPRPAAVPDPPRTMLVVIEVFSSVTELPPAGPLSVRTLPKTITPPPRASPPSAPEPRAPRALLPTIWLSLTVRVEASGPPKAASLPTAMPPPKAPPPEMPAPPEPPRAVLPMMEQSVTLAEPLSQSSRPRAEGHAKYDAVGAGGRAAGSGHRRVADQAGLGQREV